MGEETIDATVPNRPRFHISVYSDLVIPKSFVRDRQLSMEAVMTAHWCVMEHCTEAANFISKHREKLLEFDPDVTDEERIQHFHPYFRQWVRRYLYLVFILYM